MTNLSRFTSEEIRAELARRDLGRRARRPQGRRESAELLLTPREGLEGELEKRGRAGRTEKFMDDWDGGGVG